MKFRLLFDSKFVCGVGIKLAAYRLESGGYFRLLSEVLNYKGKIMVDPKSERSDKKGNLYKILNEYLDRKIQKDKDKIVEKYFDVNSQENLLKSFTVNNIRVNPSNKK